jgi:hypothetical protein
LRLILIQFAQPKKWLVGCSLRDECQTVAVRR